MSFWLNRGTPSPPRKTPETTSAPTKVVAAAITTSTLKVQTYSLVRGGIQKLLSRFRSDDAVAERVVLDILGGDGLVRKVAAHLRISGLDILTCDMSKHMSHSAWASGMPAILQRANRLLCRSRSVDGVLLAYGTHHIEPYERPSAFKEAHRVLRPGGVLVVHDFEVGGAMEEWFETIVDPFYETGHRFKHFTRDGLAAYTEIAGFSRYRIFDMVDSYRIVAESPEDAELRMGKYLVDMYGLVKVEQSSGAEEAARWVMGKARDIFGRKSPAIGPIFDKADQIWRIEVPRTALVAVGMRPQAGLSRL